ncbi:MAG: elongation factor G [Armatimonadota bacterium]|nr:elongation factor G [Armatimonadota bacterium]MDR7452559.1 elongation factor G [Armatimonadota bacterium]MDR7492638.1 elongation factor G [Armatimonadota bacterium]MDR7500000.1 elongation factor G [Armatimonadota bacterium]MDR7504193.1 elongation factor G [Armatimonadota bacterium]
MKAAPAERIRNVAVVGHGGTGKTSLVEAMLFLAGAVDRLGRVDDGTATTDFDPEEQRRRHTINASLAPLEWKGCKINLIDAPGYPDFVGEVAAALRVVEGALVVVDAVAGVQVQTEVAWGYADRGKVSRLVIVNRLDRENARFEAVLQSLRQRFGTRVAPIQIPIGVEAGLSGVVDLLQMTAYTFKNGEAARGEIPAELREAAQSAREKLVEAAAETDDALVEKYLERGELTQEELMHGLRAGVRAGTLVPVLCAAALRLLGVSTILDAVATLLPAPTDRPEVPAAKGGQQEITLTPDADGPTAALVFKTVADPYVGKLSYFRVYSGVIRSDSQVLNASKNKPERIGQVYFVRGKQQEPTAQVGAGDIGAVAKLVETGTGDTLSGRDQPIVLPPIAFPRPAISMAIEPKSKGDEDKMGTALARLAEEDPTFRVHRDAELKQTVISGMGESHLEIMADRLRRKFGVDVVLHLPRVPYRETVKGRAKAQGRYVKQTGGRGQYGVCFLEVEPLERGAGFEFVDKIFGGAIPNQFIPSVEKGVRKTLEEGVLAGYPVVDVRVTLYDGKYHEVDSSDIAFQIAGSMAFKDAATEAGLVLLEPIMDLKVRVPEEQMGDVIGDLNAKRGRIMGMEPQGDGTTVVLAQVPQAELLRYASDLRSMTGGRGTFEATFSHYEEVPPHVAEKVVAQARQQKAEAATR